MAQVKILDLRKVPDPAPGGGVRVVTWVTYQPDGGAPLLVILPKEAPSEQEVQQAIKADLETRARILGKTFSV